jgi:ABC-type transport system involved in Fe-S cluster assembly fused permease/ATPase subunit
MTQSPPKSAAPKIETHRTLKDTVRNLAHHLWPLGYPGLRMRVVLSMLALVLAKVVNVYGPFLYKDAIDGLTVKPIIALPIGFIVAYALSRVMTQVFGELRDYLFISVAQYVQRVIALETFHHLHYLSLAFHLDRQTGGLTRVIERGTRAIQTVLSFMLFNIGPTLLEILMVSIILWVKFNWKYAVVTFVTVSLYVYFTFAITNWRTKFRRSMNDRDTEANTKAIDSLLNYETVKYFGNEEHEYRRYDVSLAAYQVEAIRSQASLSLLNIGQGFIIGICVLSTMYMSASGVMSGQFTVGDFVLVNTLLLQLFVPLGFLGFVYREVNQGLVDMEKMFELLALGAEITDSPNAVPLEASSWDVEFDHVSFSYGPDRPILKDVSFKIPAGQTLAIVGPSGSGKSTIARLIFRFYDATKGEVRVGGRDVRTVKQKTLRAALGIVPQDTVLFNDSIGYNIGYGRPAATFDEIRNAARLSQIDQFVETLPKKYDTPVGERGLKLSGGEKQRVAIARTILKNPPVLLFDEATSALDSHTEKEIQASLRDVSRNRTTLVIAHRLSTIIDADQILVLKNGEVVERGRHADLLALGGEYAAMWRKQQEEQRNLEKKSEVHQV